MYQWIHTNYTARNEYVLDAKTPPDFPVMVVGINERTDEEGNVTFLMLELLCEDSCGGEGSSP